MCTETGSCQQYCEALRLQVPGIAIEAGACTVPSMFTVTEQGIDFEIPEGDILNPQLVDRLGGALCGVLVEHQRDRDQADVERLIAGHDAVLGARFTLWNSMIDATRAGRTFTDAELEYYQGQIEAAKATMPAALSLEIAGRAQAAHDKRTLTTYDLLFDEQIISVVDRLVGNLTEGKPTLLVGDKGIAKTQIAKFVARLCDPDEVPLVIPGHGDMMSNEFMGQAEIVDGSTVHKNGTLVEARIAGRPVILDEINVTDQAVAMRLQDELLARPGDRVRLHENGGDESVIRPGFVVFATANEASVRYQHRTTLDPAFRDRFDVVELAYPDGDTDPIADVPRSLMRLVLAAAVDEHARLSRHLQPTALEELARLSRATQYLYSVPSQNVRFLDGLHPSSATSRFMAEEPVMTDCITPRSLFDVVTRSAGGNKPGMDLATAQECLIRSLDQAGRTHNQEYARSALALLRRGV